LIKAKILNAKIETSQYTSDATQTYQMYLTIFPKAVISIKTKIFHVFVLARNRLTIMLASPGTQSKKYRFPSQLLLKIYHLSRSRSFPKKMHLDIYSISRASLRSNCLPIKIISRIRI
jgi:hypothetical protein